ncbi:hypothetical protein EW146_g9689 [Bondarzewia mesenterica]|uniref:Plastocyanin-like domain-containing protein n=1 Tax=Bondarzewia mesenterica TaxID=1095465 RepID=A0A4S4L4E0_9AGAM|nr:hypothetical protein EW146_g9689 [Bondarzewia mesenterica]
MFPILMPPSDYRALDLPLLQKVYLTRLIHCREYRASACVVRRIDLAGSVVKGQNSTWLSSISLALLDLSGRVLDAEDRYILLVKTIAQAQLLGLREPVPHNSGLLIQLQFQHVRADWHVLVPLALCSVDSYIHLYDVDNVHIDRREWTGTTMFEGTRPFGHPASTLINSLGRSSEGPALARQLFVSLTARSESVRRFCQGSYELKGLGLTIIEADGVLTKPLVVDQLWTFAGQRYSIILNANQLIGNYWIRAILSVGDASTAGGCNSAVLRYSLALPLDPISSYMPTNPLNESNLHALEDPEAKPWAWRSKREHQPPRYLLSPVRVRGHDPSSSAAPRPPKPTSVSKPRLVPDLHQSGLSRAKPLRPAPPPPPRPDIVVPKRIGQSVVSADRNSASIKTKPLSAHAHAWCSVEASEINFKNSHPLVTDIRSEGGTAEVLGLFLQQHGTGYTSVGDRELSRGLELSPQKAGGSGGAKGPRYLSGGLAERSSRTIHQYQMSSSLWYKETSRHGISIRHSSPDLKMRIHRVLNIVCGAGRTKPNRGQEGEKTLVLFALLHLSGGEVKRLEEGELGVGKDVPQRADTRARRRTRATSRRLRHGQQPALRAHKPHARATGAFGRVHRAEQDAGNMPAAERALHLGLCVRYRELKRPPDEVDALMHLAEQKLVELCQHGELLQQYGVRLNVLGHIELLAPNIRDAVYKAQDLTRNNDNPLVSTRRDFALAHSSPSLSFRHDGLRPRAARPSSLDPIPLPPSSSTHVGLIAARDILTGRIVVSHLTNLSDKLFINVLTAH